MYWIFLLMFIVAVLIPDIIRSPVSFLAEERAEEAAIFLLGALAFFIFIRNEVQILFHKKEKERDQKKIDQTVKDLVESYSYIGEVNRKMDILMNIALGISDRSMLNKRKEKDIYESIISAANFLMKADGSSLKFVNLSNNATEKEVKTPGKHIPSKNEELVKIKDETLSKNGENYLIIASPQTINNIRSYMIIIGYDEGEEANPKNIEILKVFASQSIFLYSYMNLEQTNCDCEPDK